jgi:hypothetical protein
MAKAMLMRFRYKILLKDRERRGEKVTEVVLEEKVEEKEEG